MRVRSWPGLALARPLWPGSAEGQGQGQPDCGPALEGQGQVRKNWAGPGPDRTSDSLAAPAAAPPPTRAQDASRALAPQVCIWRVRMGGDDEKGTRMVRDGEKGPKQRQTHC